MWGEPKVLQIAMIQLGLMLLGSRMAEKLRQSKLETYVHQTGVNEELQVEVSGSQVTLW